MCFVRRFKAAEGPFSSQSFKTSWPRAAIWFFVSLAIHGFHVRPAASEEDPLLVDELLAQDGEIRLELGIALVTSDEDQVETAVEVIQIDDGSFVSIPVAFGEGRRAVDVWTLSTGVRYGITSRSEISARANAVFSDVRLEQLDQSSSDDTDLYFNSVTFGANHRFLDDSTYPAVIGFVDLTAAENTNPDSNEFAFLKSGGVGFTAYRLIDPLVLSLTSGFRYSLERHFGSQDIDPGDLIFFAPAVDFAVNPEVTLSAGTQILFRQRDEVDGTNLGIRTTDVNLLFGVGFAWSENLTVFGNVRADVTGESRTNLDLSVSYGF